MSQLTAEHAVSKPSKAHTKLFASLALVCLTVATCCKRAEPMDAYPQFTELWSQPYSSFPPVILVGRILEGSKLGLPRPSRWNSKVFYQQYKVRVAVENVLRGSVAFQVADIYFLVNIRAGGLIPLGTIHQGGQWHIGDREMFFLQLDLGRLRTVCDNWAHCVIPVLTGFHKTLAAHPNVGESIADVLLTRGQGASDVQMIRGLEHSTDIGFSFAVKFSMAKLEQLAQTETPPVRQAVCGELRRYSRSLPYKDPNSPENPYYPKTLAEDPDFRKAIAACPAEHDISNGER